MSNNQENVINLDTIEVGFNRMFLRLRQLIETQAAEIQALKAQVGAAQKGKRDAKAPVE